MSRVSKRQTDKEKLKKQKKATTTNATQSPCGRKPKQIAKADITLTFIETDSQKNQKYRLRVTWPEVTEDIDGFPVSTIDRYIVHLQHSDDNINWDTDFRRKVVDAKDGDDNTTAKAIFKNIRRKRYYRVRVRAKDSAGCKSELSDWTDAQRPGGADTVPSVGTIRKTRVGPRRIEFDWDDVDHPDFDRYKVVILRADTSTAAENDWTVVRTRYTRQSHIAVHVPDTDKTKWWKVRVRVQLQKNPDGTVDEGTDNDSSADQADDSASGGGATIAPTNPSSITLKRRVKGVLVEWDDEQADAAEPTTYEVLCKKSTVTNWPTPPRLARVGQTKGSSFLVTKYYNGSGFTDFVKGDYANTFDFKLRSKNKIGETITYATNAEPTDQGKPARGQRRVVGDGGNPAAVTGLTRTKVAPRRIEWTWTESPDADVDRYRVEILRSDTATGSTTPYKTAYTRATFYRLAIPEGDKAKYFRARVYAETEPDDAGTRQSSSVAQDSNGDISDDVVADVADSLSAGAIGNLTPFASSIKPIQIFTSLPTFNSTTYPEGTVIFNKADDKLYRSTGSAWVASVPTVDLTGQITTTQITNNAVTTEKINALAVNADKIAANAITSLKIAADAVTAGKIAAAAIKTRELDVANVTIQNLQTAGTGGRVAIMATQGNDRIVFGYGSNFIKGLSFVGDSSGNVTVTGTAAQEFRFSSAALCIPVSPGLSIKAASGSLWISNDKLAWNAPGGIKTLTNASITAP